MQYVYSTLCSKTSFINNVSYNNKKANIYITRGHPTSCLNANVPVPSGPLSLRNGLLIFGIVCKLFGIVTLLIFRHSLHLSAQLNVSSSVISSTLHSFLRTGIVSLTFVLMFLFYFYLFFKVTVSAVLQPLSHLPYAICSSCTLCCMCSWQINDDDDDKLT